MDGVLSLTFLGAEYISLGKYSVFEGSVFEGSGDRIRVAVRAVIVVKAVIVLKKQSLLW